MFPNSDIYGIHRPLVYMNMAMGGVSWRGPKNQHAAVDLHAFGGMSRGVFDAGTDGAGPGALTAHPKRTPGGALQQPDQPSVRAGRKPGSEPVPVHWAIGSRPT